MTGRMEKKRSIPYSFSGLHDDHEENLSQRKRRLVMKTWLILVVGAMFILIGVSSWAIKKSHEKESRYCGTCFMAPSSPGDRRVNKDLLSIVNYNAEWLFIHGGSGDIRCPSESCSWAVQQIDTLSMNQYY